jgi:hypothetical protein
MLSKDLIFRKKEECSHKEHSSGAILLVRHAESGFTPFFTPKWRKIIKKYNNLREFHPLSSDSPKP